MSRSLKTTRNLSQIAEKKLVGKAHSSANKTDNAEDIPSAVQLNTTTIFGQAVPSSPSDSITTTLYGVTGTVQKVQFDVEEIGLTRYDADASTEAGGDDSPQSNGPHGWALKLTSDYESQSGSNHSKVGTAPYKDGTKVFETLGALQIVPTNMYINSADPANNPYIPKIYTWDGSNNSSKSATPLTISDHLDWFVDAYAGTVFFQEYDGRVPYKVEAYIYVGDMASTTGGAGAFTDLSDTPNNYTGAASKFVKVNSGGNGLEFATATIPSGIGDLSDVTAPASGDANKFLKVNGSGNAIVYTSHSIPSTINDLTNVNTGSPSNDQVLLYNSSSSQWVAENQGNSETVSGFSSLRAPHAATTKEITVTVAGKSAAHRYNGTGSGSGYLLDGVESPFLTLTPGRTYRFLQSDGSNGGHPLRFYYDAARTLQYTAGVTTNGTAGNAGAYTQIVINDDTPMVLHYQCSAHGYMGNAIHSNANVIDTKNLASLRNSANVTGNLSVTESISGFDSLIAPHSDTIKTYAVTVAGKDSTHRYQGTGSGYGYKIDGIFSPFLTLTPGRIYRFDQSHSSNSGHPLRFYYDAAKTVQYTTNVSSSGSAGNSGAYVQITVTDSTPTILHYQCTAHGYMGNSIQTSARNLTGYSLKDIPDVHTATPTNGQALVWDNSNSYWKPGNIDSGGIERYSYTQTGSSVSADTAITISGMDFNGATPSVADTKVFLNGQLLTGGTTTQLANDEVDYAFSSDTQIKFGFVLEVSDHISIYYITTSFSTGKDILLHTDDAAFNNGRVITAGDGITISTATPRQLVINNSGLLQRTKEYFTGLNHSNDEFTFTFAGSINFGTVGHSDHRIDVFVDGLLKEKDQDYSFVDDGNGGLENNKIEWIGGSTPSNSARFTIIIF